MIRIVDLRKFGHKWNINDFSNRTNFVLICLICGYEYRIINCLSANKWQIKITVYNDSEMPIECEDVLLGNIL